MSTIEHAVNNDTTLAAERIKKNEPILSRILKFLCSVRLGVILLILLGLACFLGMVIMQQNVDGFERYFAELTPLSGSFTASSISLTFITHGISMPCSASCL